MPLSCKYPMYAMRVADFLALERMLPHQELQARGLVVPLDMDAEHEPACVHFISHQWLGFRTADPHGVHLRCMQDVFRERSPESRSSAPKRTGTRTQKG
jgi:hypothetical protein